MTNKAISEVVRYYTRESGVRNLEREIARSLEKLLESIQKDRARTSQERRTKIKNLSL